ncbi:MAG: GH25 family lysozyme [Microbacteriaceae bacterium]
MRSRFLGALAAAATLIMAAGLFSTPFGASATANTTTQDPSLAEMNATGNHSMGSTVATRDPDFVTPSLSPTPSTPSFSMQSLSSLSLSSPSLSSQSFSAQSSAVQSSQIPPGAPGLDVSGWQVLSAADWRQIWANGARFAYVKATESTDYVSSQFAEQYNDSNAAGLIRGAYHFATPDTSSGTTQANFFVDHGGGWTNDGRTLPPLLDIEYNPYGQTCYNKTPSQMVAWILDFSNTIQTRTGRAPAIYSTTNWWVECTGNSSAFSANPLFIASWPSDVSRGPGTLPAGWSSYAIWQFADAYYSNGASGLFPGDQDVFNGDLAQLQAFAGGGPATVAPTPQSPIIGVGDFDGDGHADLVGRKPDGTLWLYPGDNDGGFRPGLAIGSGWGSFDAVFGAGDFDGDGHADLVGRSPDGTLWLYPGDGSGGFLSPRVIGSGWGVFDTVFSAGDFSGDGHADLVGRKPDGTLWLYPGNGAGGFLSATQIGVGWGVFDTVFGAGDFSGDGHADLVGRKPDGTLWLYPGDGGSGFGTPSQIGVGWGIFDTVFGVGDFSGDAHADIVGRRSDATLVLYPGDGNGGFLSPHVIGSGWGIFDTVFGAGDFSGDGRADLVGRKPDGGLWLYSDTRTSDSGGRGYQQATQIGTGWGIFDTVFGAGDFSGDGHADLVGRKPDGTLWLYPGDGAGGFLSPRVIGSGWGIFDTVFGAGDFSGDGHADLVGRKPDGTLWLYPRDGGSGFQDPFQIGWSK